MAMPGAGASVAARRRLLTAVQLLSSLARRAGPDIAHALAAADVLAVVRQLWMLANVETGVLRALLSLLGNLATSGQ